MKSNGCQTYNWIWFSDIWYAQKKATFQTKFNETPNEFTQLFSASVKRLGKLRKFVQIFPQYRNVDQKTKVQLLQWWKVICATLTTGFYSWSFCTQEIYISGQNSVKMSPQKCCRLATKIVENHWTFAPQSKASQQKSGKNKFHFLDMTSSEFCTYSCHAFLTIWCAQMTKFRQIL